MSIRFHRGPKLLTIFHDPSSRASSQVLSLLQARRAPPVLLPPSQGQSQQQQQQAPKGPAREYLDRATEHELDDPLFELEVRSLPGERPTAEQWNLMGEYLDKRRRTDVELLKGEPGPFVVDWEGGAVERDEEGVKKLLDRLQKEQESGNKGNGAGSGCIIS